jgi:lysophospholipase L1-like esterase
MSHLKTIWKTCSGSLIGVAVTVVTTALLALLIESGTRFYYHYESRRFIHPYLGETNKPHYHRSSKTPEGESFEYRTNNYGFRGDEIPDRKPAGAVYVFSLGGSTTACDEYPQEKTWSGVLQEHLRKALGNNRVHVYNTGMGGGTSYRSMVIFLNLLTRLDPDLVIVYEGVNDVGEPTQPSHARYFRDIGNRENFMRRRSYFLVELARRSQNPLVIKLEGWLHGGWQITQDFSYHEKNYRDISYLARGYRIPVMFMTQPVMPKLAEDPRDINASTLRLGAEFSVPVFDLARIMPRDFDHFLSDRVHYRARGNQWIGEHLAGWILEKQLWRRPEAIS